MTMKNPSHPGELVKANLEDLGVSVAAASKTMQVTRQQLYKIMRGESSITPDMALRFEQAFGGTADLWLRLQTAYDLAQARNHGKTPAISRLTDHHAGL